MKMKSTSWEKLMSAGLLAGAVTTLGILPQARGELVYEPEVSAQAPAAVRADDREQMRTALSASERAQSTVQAAQPVQQVVAQPVYQQPVYQQQPMVQYQAVQQVAQPQQYAIAPAQQQVIAPVAAAPAGVSAESAPQTEVQSLSKTELMRRERTRTELKNEDLLEERLEELRLRDEKKRTDGLLGQDPGLNAQSVQTVAPISGLATQGVVSPVTDHAGIQMAAPIPTAEQANAPAPGLVSPYTQQAQYQQASAQSVTAGASVVPSESPGSKISISPRFGISSMSANSAFQVKGKFAVGLGLDLPVSDNIAFELGYTYNQYGVNLPGYGGGYNGGYYGGYNQVGTQQDQFTLKQNVIDAGIKAYVLGADYKFRPYVAGGGGYAMSSLNYPDQVINMYPGGYQPQSYSSNTFTAYVGTGFDATVAKNVALGLNFRYYQALSTNSSDQLYYGYGNYNGGTQLVGASLSESSFYSFFGDCSFSF